MSHHRAPTPHPVVVLDTTPPRPQPSAHTASSEVIVLDNSPQMNPSIAPNTPSNHVTNSPPIVVEEHPPKRRRHDNPAALPVHPRATTPSQGTPPVIVVEDEDTSDPDTPPTMRNPSQFASAAPTPIAAPRTHLRLPRINTTRNVRMQDEVIEMSATGPTVNRNSLSAQAPSTQHTRLPIPPNRARHTSMPPLFSFEQRNTTVPEVSAPTPSAGRRCPTTRASIPMRNPQSTPRVNNTPNTPNPALSIFPPPLPEQALPSTGRRTTRLNRRVTFSNAIPEDVISHTARRTLSVVRDLEGGTARSTRGATRVRRHEVEPFLQVVSGGPAVIFEYQPASIQNQPPSHMSSGRIGQEAHPQPSYPHTNMNMSRNQGPDVTQVPGSRSGNPGLSRAGIHRAHGIPGQRMSRAYAQQLNAMHAASNGMPLQEDGTPFVAQNSANRSSATRGSLSSGPMIVSSTIRSSAGAQRSVASTVDTAVAEATSAMMAARFPAGLALSTNRNQLSYGSGPGFSIASSGNSGSGRRSNQERQAVARRHHQRLRRMQQQLRILGSVTTGIEIQYLHGIPGDGPLDYEQLIRLDEQLIRDKNRADQTQIDSLPVRVAANEDKEIRCCICMCDVEEGEELRVLPCSHKYHKGCIDQWLTYNGCCPVDKKRIAHRAPLRSRSTH